MIIGEKFGVGSPKLSRTKLEKECVNPNLVIGLELETENCGGRSETFYQDVSKATNFIVKTDGSLRGVAYEFISRPMRTANALVCLETFLNQTGFTEGNYTDRCSVHVHVNCTDMTTEQVVALSLLYSVFEEILFEFVGHDRETNIYCIPWNHCRAHFELVRTFVETPDLILSRWNKYTALNLLPLSSIGTVEFRQMHGTADMEKLTKWINIIGAMFAYANSVQLNDLITQIKELNNTSQYETFFTRVLQGQLPYNETYRQKLEDGVVMAKYSMIKPQVGNATKKVADAMELHRQRMVDEIMAYTPAPVTGFLRPRGMPLGATGANPRAGVVDHPPLTGTVGVMPPQEMNPADALRVHIRDIAERQHRRQMLEDDHVERVPATEVQWQPYPVSPLFEGENT